VDFQGDEGVSFTFARLHFTREQGVLENLARGAVLADEVTDAVAFVDELLLALLHAIAEPVVDFKARNNLVRTITLGSARHRVHDALCDAVRVTVGEDGGGEPVTLWRRVDQVSNGVGDGDGRRGGRRAPPLLDQQTTAGLDGWSEVVFEPVDVVDDVCRLGAANLRVHKVRNLRRGVVTPDAHVADRFVENARLESELALGAVFIELGERVKVARVEVWRVRERDERVRVARVTDNDHLARGLGHIIQSLALLDENLTIHLEQVAAFHTRTARLGADEQRPVGVFKNLSGIDSNVNLAKKREQTILQLHSHALERVSRSLAPEQSQNNGLVWSKDGARRNLKQQVVRDLTRRPAHRDHNRRLPRARSVHLILRHVVLEPKHPHRVIRLSPDARRSVSSHDRLPASARRPFNLSVHPRRRSAHHRRRSPSISDRNPRRRRAYRRRRAHRRHRRHHRIKSNEEKKRNLESKIENPRKLRATERPSDRFPRDSSRARSESPTRPSRCDGPIRIVIDLNHHRSESPGHAREPRKTRRRDREWFLLEARADGFSQYLYMIWLYRTEALIPPVPVDQWVDALTRCSENVLK